MTYPQDKYGNCGECHEDLFTCDCVFPIDKAREEIWRLRETLRTIGQLAKDKESQGEVMIALAVREALGEQ